MAGYLALQIMKGKLSYRQCTEKFPQHKDAINIILIGEGREDLIVEL